MQETLLERFIRERVEAYVEPSRRGTPRGEPIGLSKVKYQAAVLIAVTSKPLFEIAREVSVSYGLVRKWGTETTFQKVIHQLQIEFAGLVQAYLLERLQTVRQISDDEHRAIVEAEAREAPQKIPVPASADLSLIMDAYMYSAAVKQLLADWAMEQDPAISVALLMGIVRDEKRWLKYERGFLISWIRRDIDVLLSGKTLNKRSRGDLVLMLRLVQRHLEQLGD
jgi:hypothetical protein